MDIEAALINNVPSMADSSEPPKKTGMGARLKAARENLHLSQKEVATRLYLNPKIIALIEEEAFLEGPPATFMRGYIRSYAKLLNFSENEIKAALNGIHFNLPVEGNTYPTLPARSSHQGERYMRWITLFIVLILTLLVSIWWRSHSQYTIADIPRASFLKQKVETSNIPKSFVPPALSENHLPDAINPPPLPHSGDTPPVKENNAPLPSLTPENAALPATELSALQKSPINAAPGLPPKKKSAHTDANLKKNIVMSLPEPE